MKDIIYDKNISWRLRRISNKNLIMSNVEAFELNELGLTVWNMIDGSKSLEEIINDIINEYDVTKEQLEQDIVDFCSNLEVNHVLVRCNSEC